MALELPHRRMQRLGRAKTRLILLRWACDALGVAVCAVWWPALAPWALCAALNVDAFLWSAAVLRLSKPSVPEDDEWLNAQMGLMGARSWRPNGYERYMAFHLQPWDTPRRLAVMGSLFPGFVALVCLGTAELLPAWGAPWACWLAVAPGFWVIDWFSYTLRWLRCWERAAAAQLAALPAALWLWHLGSPLQAGAVLLLGLACARVVWPPPPASEGTEAKGDHPGLERPGPGHYQVQVLLFALQAAVSGLFRYGGWAASGLLAATAGAWALSWLWSAVLVLRRAEWFHVPPLVGLATAAGLAAAGQEVLPALASGWAASVTSFTAVTFGLGFCSIVYSP